MPSAARRPTLVAALVCADVTALVLAGIGLWHGTALWSTSDGVYAMTARELLHGHALYADVAAAQPPPVYLAGAGLLGIDDSLTALRAGLLLAPLAAALLVWWAVLCLTGRRALAALAGVLTPLTPVMLHEGGLLTPETLGAPLLLAVAVAAARSRAAAAGVLAALACATKLSFVLPAVAVLAVAPVRGRALAWFAASGAALAAVATAIWGTRLWESIVVAQAQSGNAALHDAAGLVAQEGWTAAGLVVLAGLALASGRRAADPALLRCLAAAAAGGLVLGLGVVKLGSYVNVVQVAEPPLLALAACGAAWAIERRGALAAAAAVAALLVAAQSASLLLRPGDPRPYTRPGSDSGPRRVLAAADVRRLARDARECPAGAPYPGIPFVAFVAGRRVLGDQPDRFILATRANRELAAAAARDLPAACPRQVPALDARGELTAG